jgi:16S rRNA (guanine527-N7)-methyltransferase
VAPEGAMVAMKGSSIEDEIEAAEATLRTLKCAPPEVVTLGAGLAPSTTTAVRVTWADPAAIGWRPSGTGSRRGRSRRR